MGVPKEIDLNAVESDDDDDEIAKILEKGAMTDINIDVEFNANYEETNATIPIFTTDMISYFEKELNNTVKEQIEGYEKIRNIIIEKNKKRYRFGGVAFSLHLCIDKGRRL